MKKLIRLLLLITIATYATPLQKTITEPFDHEYPLKTVEQSIETAAKDREWAAKKLKGENAYEAKLHHRGFLVHVKIVYTKRSVDVIYINSEGLDYDGTNIHAKYGKWVKLLTADIEKNLFASGK